MKISRTTKMLTISADVINKGQVRLYLKQEFKTKVCKNRHFKFFSGNQEIIKLVLDTTRQNSCINISID